MLESLIVQKGKSNLPAKYFSRAVFETDESLRKLLPSWDSKDKLTTFRILCGEASISGQISRVIDKFLIAEVSNNEKHDFRLNALVVASAQHEHDLMERLLTDGVDPNVFSPTFGYPLAVAAREDNIETFNLLIRHGAKLLPGSLPSDFRDTPLGNAIIYGSTSSIPRLILTHNMSLAADQRIPSEHIEQAMTLASWRELGFDIILKFIEAANPTKMAGIFQSITQHQCVQVVAKIHAEFCKAISRGIIPWKGIVPLSKYLEIVAAKGPKTFDRSIEQCIEQGEQISPPGLYPTMLWAVCEGRVNHIERLLILGADINARSPFPQHGLLYFAAGSKHLDVVELLLKRNIVLEPIDPPITPTQPVSRRTRNEAGSALLVAIQNGSYEIVRSLVKAGTSVTKAAYIRLERDPISPRYFERFYTPIIMAKLALQPDIVQYLLENGAEDEEVSLDHQYVEGEMDRGVFPIQFALEPYVTVATHSGKRWF